MIKTIPVVFRRGVFIPLTPVKDIAEETTLEIEVHGPLEKDVGLGDVKSYTLEENLRVLRESAGILGGDLPAEEVRYVIESPDLAQENIHPPINQLADEDESYTTASSE